MRITLLVCVLLVSMVYAYHNAMETFAHDDESVDMYAEADDMDMFDMSADMEDEAEFENAPKPSADPKKKVKVIKRYNRSDKKDPTYSPIKATLRKPTIGLTSMFIKGNCDLSCPSGYTLRKKKDYVAKANGCGPASNVFGINSIINAVPPQLMRCCDKHDLCYAKCGASRVECDGNMKKCFKQEIDSMKKRPEASLTKLEKKSITWKLDFTYHVGVRNPGGCLAFKSAQEEGCTCLKNLPSKLVPQ